MVALGIIAAAAVTATALLAGVLIGRPGAASPSTGGETVKLVSLGSSSSSSDSTPTITVTGTGQVFGSPDTLTLQIGITAGGSTATGALDEADSRMAALQGSFMHSGVPKAELQTSGLNLNANYNQYNVLTGFSASEELTVIMHDVYTAGAVIGAAADVAGNFAHIDDISFSISNQSALLAQARAQAMQNAKTQAIQIANGAGVRLGPVRTVVDEEGQPTNYNSYGDYNGPLDAAAAPSFVPLQGGKQSLSITVSVVYTLIQ